MLAVAGFRDEPELTAAGGIYRGRLAMDEVQWTGHGEDAVATFTMTASQVADAILNQMIWTDQSVQRGIQPTAPSDTPRELPVSDGYPDERLYIFNRKNADDIVTKLLAGDRLFLNPLVWNLRPGEFSGYWNAQDRSIILYSGRIYLPDSHHRHQAILKAVLAARESPRSFPKFSIDREFKIEMYFLSREDEGNYFFDKNQRPRPTAKSKAYDLTTQDDLSVLAKRTISHSENLTRGVNRVTDRLSRRAPHFMTLSTLREMMRTYAGTEEVDETEMEGLAVVAADFLDLLATIRPELRASHNTRPSNEDSLASAAVMLHGYAALMRDYGLSVAESGLGRAHEDWSQRLDPLRPSAQFQADGWHGDFLSKQNPVWESVGVIKKDPETGRLTVTNTGGTRTRTGRVLRRYVSGDFRHASDLART